MSATPLEPSHRSAIRRLLEKDVASNLFPLSVLEQEKGERQEGLWIGVWKNRIELDAVAFVSRSVSPTTGNPRFGNVAAYGDPNACHQLGRLLAAQGRVKMIFGPRAESDAFWSGIGEPHCRFSYAHQLYECCQVVGGKRIELSLAQLDDLQPVAALASAMLLEDLGVSRLRDTPLQHLLWVRNRISSAKTWIHKPSADPPQDIAFVINVGCNSQYGVQVGGTFVPPAHRNQGLATAGMRTICQDLLNGSPTQKPVTRITLLVNEENQSAIRCYENAGFEQRAPFRFRLMG
jgi:predicted GNAT family acetyltransferase